MLSLLCKTRLLRTTDTLSRTVRSYVLRWSLSKYRSDNRFHYHFGNEVLNLCTPQYRLNLFRYSSASGSAEFDKICKETLESLAEYFEELSEGIPILKSADIAYSDGVITAFLGDKFGTYVINRQTPNQQIWLSSPISGPKRYDLIGGIWVYKHDNTSLHSFLDREIGGLVDQPLQFSSRCSFGE